MRAIHRPRLTIKTLFAVAMMIALFTTTPVLAQGPDGIALQHAGGVAGAVWNSSETNLLSWSADGTAKVWDTETGEEMLVLRHETSVVGATWRNQDTEILTVTRDGTITIWDALNGTSGVTIPHELSVSGAAWMNEGANVLVWTADDVAYSWAIEPESTDQEIGSANTQSSTETAAETVEGMPAEGKWRITFGSEYQQCPGQNWVIQGETREFILELTENQTFVTDDIFVWPPLTFTPNREGVYHFLRNMTSSSGLPVTYEYLIDEMSSNRIVGQVTDFYPAINCYLVDSFQMVLVDENQHCMIGTERGANLRQGPGTEYATQGNLPAKERVDAIGQAVGSAGFVWYQLEEGLWVRSDVVEEAGYCAGLPTVTPGTD